MKMFFIEFSSPTHLVISRPPISWLWLSKLSHSQVPAWKPSPVFEFEDEVNCGHCRRLHHFVIESCLLCRTTEKRHHSWKAFSSSKESSRRSVCKKDLSFRQRMSSRGRHTHLWVYQVSTSMKMLFSICFMMDNSMMMDRTPWYRDLFRSMPFCKTNYVIRFLSLLSLLISSSRPLWMMPDIVVTTVTREEEFVQTWMWRK